MDGLNLDDYTKLDDDAIQGIIDSGGAKTPADFAVDDPPPADSNTDATPDASATALAKIDDSQGQISTSDASQTPDTQVTADDFAAIEQKVASFAFTENAAPEVLATEEQQYLSMVELPTPLQQIIERKDAQIRELSLAKPMDESTQTHMQAFNHLATEFVKTEHEEWVPDTQPIRNLLEKTYPMEYEQLLTDALSSPSPKYPQWTKMMEIIKDTFSLTDTALETLEAVLENKGHFPRPNYLPEGIDRRFLDAYWYAPDREEIDTQLERAVSIWRDPNATPSEKAMAKSDLSIINQKLAREQRMIEAEQKEANKDIENRLDLQDYARTKGLEMYKETVVSFIKNATDKLTKRLEPIDGTAAPAVAAGFTQLVINAFSEEDAFAAFARQQIKSIGINASYVAPAQVLIKILENCSKIKYLKKIEANKRAVEIEQASLAENLRQLTALEQDLVGQYIATRTKASGDVVKAQTLKVPVLVKDQTAAVGRRATPPVPTPGATNLTAAERAWMDDPNTSAEDVQKFIDGLMKANRDA